MNKEQEPVAYLNPDDFCVDTAFRWCKIDVFTQPVYTHPQPKQKPLTDDECLNLSEGCTAQYHDLLELCRKVEAAHEIKE